MKKRLLCAVLLMCGYASAQQINPSQIQPSTTDGYVVTTVDGVTAWAPGGGSSNCTSGCFLYSPAGAQTGIQPSGTTAEFNNFANQFYANLYGTGSNGIATVYNNASDCLAQGNGISFGCFIQVSPLYTNADAPQGWQFGGDNFGNATGATQMPPGAAVLDSRNGTTTWLFHDPMNPVTGQNGGVAIRNDWDLSLGQRAYVNGGGASSGLQIAVNEYAGGYDFDFYPFMTQYVNQDYRYGLNLTQDNWTDGIDFGELEIMNHHGQGDAYLHWERLLCDGGILAGNSEGCAIADSEAGENTTVFAGTMTSVTPTAITVNCTQGCGTQGPERQMIDISSSSIINPGTAPSGYVGPQTTGSASNSAVMPPQIVDSTQSFPVSTMFQLCNPASNNGAGGTAGCTAGSQPIGVIPPTPLTVTITAGSVTSNVGSFTGTNALVAGQTVILYGFSGNGAPLNNLSGTVSATGLSTSAFQVNVTAPNITTTGAGKSTQSPTGFSPQQTVTLNVVAPYTGTGGDTNGLPAGFCSSSTLQSSNSGASCYLPSSGILYLTDGVEYESDNYTYNSGTQQVTITNMQFPHLNGVVAAYGGLAGYAIQDNANLANSSSGIGVTGTIAPTYAIAGSISATDLYYIPQRTNEQYGLPTLGVVNTTHPTGGTGAQMYFSVNMSSFSLSGGVVTFNMASPPNFIQNFNIFNGLIPTIVVSSNTTYNCSTCAITWVSGNTFKYTPSAPSGSVPTTGTITYNNDTYTIYPAVRVKSVYNTANKQVDGTILPYPYNTPMGVGHTAREAHYQKLQMAGRHDAINEIQPEDYLATFGQSIVYSGFFQSTQTGLAVVNQTADNAYLGRGGTRTIPTTGFNVGGDWQTSILVNSPDNSVIQVIGGKGTFDISNPYSNFNFLAGPSLQSQNPQPGTNALDCLNYDPNYQSANRGKGTFSGRWWFFNGCNNLANTESQSGLTYQSFATVEGGYLVADQGVTAKNVNANNIFTSQSTSITIFPNAITTGSTTYNYWVVGNAAGGGQTLPQAVSITNGNATPDNQICMPYQSQFSSYDILKGSTATSIALGVTVNGLSSSPVQPANYSCFTDTGGSTSAYTPPTVNTTGGANIAGPLVVGSSVSTPSVLATGIVDGTTPITITTGSTATLGGTYHSGYTFNNDGAAAVTYTLPTAAPGLQYCVASYTGATGTLKVATSASGQFIDNAGTNTASGGYVISGGALGDAGCFIGMSTTNWKLYVQSGTWTTH